MKIIISHPYLNALAALGDAAAFCSTSLEIIQTARCPELCPHGGSC